MEPLHGKLRSVPHPAPDFPLGESDSLGILLSRDLIFATKIKGTATALGYRILVANDEINASNLIEKSQPHVVFVDLTASMASASALKAYLDVAGPDVWFVAFGPHVEGAALAAAKANGCHVVLPRSRFSAELPELMRRYFTTRATDAR
jgi:hypothetical protein